MKTYCLNDQQLPGKEVIVKSPFIESIRADIRLRGYSIRTEKSYFYWVKRFIHFFGKRILVNYGSVNGHP